MKTYIKLYGPPILDALKALKKIAIDMPEVCIMDMEIEALSGWVSMDDELRVQKFFADQNFGVDALPIERCGTIISKSGERVGEYDFYFEWFDPKGPNSTMLHDLMKKTDEALAPLGCRYTLTTK